MNLLVEIVVDNLFLENLCKFFFNPSEFEVTMTLYNNAKTVWLICACFSAIATTIGFGGKIVYFCGEYCVGNSASGGSRMHLRAPKIEKFAEGGMPRDPPRRSRLMAADKWTQ